MSPLNRPVRELAVWERLKHLYLATFPVSYESRPAADWEISLVKAGADQQLGPCILWTEIPKTATWSKAG